MEADRFFNYPLAAVEEALSNALYHRAYDEREPIEVRVENDRSLKEVLKVKDYEKLLPIIEYLESNEEITTQKTEELIGKSLATAWRYLKKHSKETVE